MQMDDDAVSTALKQIVNGLFIIGARDADGNELNGMTASWLSQLSFEPRLVGVGIEKDSHTNKLISESGVFVVNVVRDGDEQLVERFTKPQEKVGDKLGETSFHIGQVGAPIFDDCASYFECELDNTVETGDHTLFIGRVVDGGVLQEDAEPYVLQVLGWEYGG
jgi:flavin reductase (DIM6/NTAB) family NADH-FMN oxidoreductase RutF